MRPAWILWFAMTTMTATAALAQDNAAPTSPEAQQQQLEELRAIQERRAALLRELQQLRDQLAESDARMAVTRERVRELQRRQAAPAGGKP